MNEEELEKLQERRREKEFIQEQAQQRIKEVYTNIKNVTSIGVEDDTHKQQQTITFTLNKEY